MKESTKMRILAQIFNEMKTNNKKENIKKNDLKYHFHSIMFLLADKKIIKKDLLFVPSLVAEVKVLIKTRLKPQ